MIVTLSGVTGTGKSFFKNAISQELNFKNLVIVTTREKRNGEINGIDKEFVSEEEFTKLKRENKIAVDFEFLGSKYAYRKENLNSDKNQVTEVHYDTIYEFNKNKDLQRQFDYVFINYYSEKAKNDLINIIKRRSEQ